MSQGNTTVVYQQNPGTSALGLAGLILSILGWLTCGSLCIPGALCSGLALFDNKPKGLAIAGLIVGFPGVLFFIFVGAGMIFAFLGIGAGTAAVATMPDEAWEPKPAIVEPIDEQPPVDLSSVVGDEPIDLNEQLSTESESTNEDPAIEPVVEDEPTPSVEPEPVVEEEPAPIDYFRVWSDTTGKFSKEAKFVKMDGDAVVIESTEGKQATIPMEKLSPADVRWINKWVLKLDVP